jgi:hypothetical protein
VACLSLYSIVSIDVVNQMECTVLTRCQEMIKLVRFLLDLLELKKSICSCRRKGFLFFLFPDSLFNLSNRIS